MFQDSDVPFKSEVDNATDTKLLPARVQKEEKSMKKFQIPFCEKLLEDQICPLVIAIDRVAWKVSDNR